MLNVEAEINQRYPDFLQKKSTRLIAKPMLATHSDYSFMNVNYANLAKPMPTSPV